MFTLGTRVKRSRKGKADLTKVIRVNAKIKYYIIRHGPFDIQGGGGLGFWSRPSYFFRKKLEQGYFSVGPSGRIIFFT